MSGRNETNADRQLRLSDLLRGPFDVKTMALTGLAVPILATFKIFCDHIEPMAPIGEFMS